MTCWSSQSKVSTIHAPSKTIIKTFERILLHQVHMNPTKYAFTIQFGKFLGYKVIQRGVKLNLENLEVIKGMKSLEPELKIADAQPLPGQIWGQVAPFLPSVEGQ